MSHMQHTCYLLVYYKTLEKYKPDVGNIELLKLRHFISYANVRVWFNL